MTWYNFFTALAWLGFFAAITISWIFYLRFRNKERMALIEKGVDAPDAFKREKFPWLKIGIVIIGICLGVALVVLSFMFQPELSRQFFAILLILSGLFFGGIAMVIAHYVDRKREE
ncbi:MAG: DUF6249 domain-containing protein [Bacteroidota bacterium]